MAAEAPLGGSRTAGRSVWRRFAARLALLTIAIQVLVVQPHIDPAIVGHPGAAISSQTVQHGVIAKADFQRAAVVCAICQAALSSRAAITPTAASAPFERQAMGAAAPLPEAPPLPATPSHAWRSRGPPTLV